MSEMALTADHLIVVGRGRLIADTSVDGVHRRQSSGNRVRVRTADPHALAALLVGPGRDASTAATTAPSR